MPYEHLGQRRRLGVLCLYSVVTCGCVVLSLQQYHTLLDWLLHNDWSMFLLWHSEFHCLYLLYYILNWMFLGPLRSFERRKARKQQLEHLANTITGICMVSGFDLLEGFCWLQWATPFGFFRMSVCVITQRIENPLPLTPGDLGSFVDPSRDESQGAMSSVTRPSTQSAETLRCRSESSCRNDKTSRGSGQPSTKEPAPFSNSSTPLETASKRVRYCKPMGFPILSYIRTSHGRIFMYALVLLFLLVLWSTFGIWIFKTLPVRIRLLILYEPFLCSLQLVFVFASCLLCLIPETSDGFPSRHDVRFFIKWSEDFLCHLLSAIRYGAMWLLFGHSLIFNFVDVFIFMKLKSVCSSLLASVQTLQIFFSIQKVLNKRLPTVYPSRNRHKFACTQTDGVLYADSPASCELCGPASSSNEGCTIAPQESQMITSETTTIMRSTLLLFPRRCFARLLSLLCCRPLPFLHLFSSVTTTEMRPSSSTAVPRCFCFQKQNQTIAAASCVKDELMYPMCVVCRELIVVGKKLPCGHIFHQHCLRQWLEVDVTCPVCRSSWLMPRNEQKLRALINTAQSLSGGRMDRIEADRADAAPSILARPD